MITMQTITTNTLTDTMYYKEIPVFTYKINYPSFTTTCSDDASESINQHYTQLAQKTEEYGRKVLYTQAAADAEYPQSPRPFPIYTLDVVYQITYNAGCIVSLYMDTYTYAGGAHGQTIRTSDTWDFNTGKSLRLTDFYPLTPVSLYQLQKSMEEQVAERLKANPGIYFEDYRALLQDTFNVNSFYIQPGMIVIYYQQYDIAPYSTGLPEFYIPVNF